VRGPVSWFDGTCLGAPASPLAAYGQQEKMSEVVRAKSTKRDFPELNFYDQDLVDLYERSWGWVGEEWRQGTQANGFVERYMCYPGSDRISQFDACLSTFFLVYSNLTFPVMSQLDNFYAKQEPDGAIRGEYDDATGEPLLSKANPTGASPPLFAWAELNIYHKIGTKKRLRDVLPTLQRHFLWLEETHRKPNGLYSVPLAATLMGNSPRTGCHYPVDFNAQQALNALCISAIGDVLNDKDLSFKYKRAYFSIKTRISSLMWDEESGFYYDLDRNEKRIKARTLAGFWSLLAEIPNEEKSERIIAQLSDPQQFGTEHPFPTLAVSAEAYDETGGGYKGSVVPAFDYMIIKGLERYEKYDLAREYALRHLYYMLDGFHPEDGSGGVWEAYAPQREGPAKWSGKKGFPRPRHMAYVAMSTVAMMIENVIGLHISLPRKTVDWRLPVLEVMGIENLNLKRNLVTIVSEKSARGWEIRLESEKLYYLTINVLREKRSKTLPIPSGKCSVLIDKI
jgi:neutral trehalase